MPNHRSLPPILGFDVSVGILPRKVAVCRNFILRAVATFWVMSLVGIYPGRASKKKNIQSLKPLLKSVIVSKLNRFMY